MRRGAPAPRGLRASGRGAAACPVGRAGEARAGGSRDWGLASTCGSQFMEWMGGCVSRRFSMNVTNSLQARALQPHPDWLSLCRPRNLTAAHAPILGQYFMSPFRECSNLFPLPRIDWIVSPDHPGPGFRQEDIQECLTHPGLTVARRGLVWLLAGHYSVVASQWLTPLCVVTPFWHF